jgi:hypothetical protein
MDLGFHEMLFEALLSSLLFAASCIFGRTSTILFSAKYTSISVSWNNWSSFLIEPPRFCRRPFGLSYAAMAGSSNMA